MNPFKNKTMAQEYARAMQSFEKRERWLFLPGGTFRPNKNNAFGAAFWRGYEIGDSQRWYRASRNTLAYAYFRAGKDIARGYSL